MKNRHLQYGIIGLTKHLQKLFDRIPWYFY